MSPPTYRERLRVEGAALAACGLVAAAATLAFSDEANDGPTSTIIQLAVVAVLMATAGVLSVRRAMSQASPLEAEAIGTGQPTALWKLPAIVAALTLAFGYGAGWDAGLRIGGGCAIVGLAQAVLFERLVATEEARRGARFFRTKGSSIFTGTNLGAVTTRRP